MKPICWLLLMFNSLVLLAQQIVPTYVSTVQKYKAQANVFFGKGNYTYAIATLTKAQNILKQNKDQKGLLALSYNFAAVDYTRGDYQKCLSLARQSLSQAGSLPDSLLQSFYYLAALSHSALSNYDSTAHYYEKIKAILDKQPTAKPTEEHIKIYKNIGQFYLNLNDYSKAELYFDKAMIAANQAQYHELLAQINNSLGYTQSLKGNWAQAIPLYQKALQTTQNPVERYFFERNLSLAYLGCGNLQMAESFLQKTQSKYLALKKKSDQLYQNNFDEILLFAFDPANLYFTKQQYPQALSHFDKTIELCKKHYNDQLSEAIYAYLGRAKVFCAQNKNHLAIEAVQQGVKKVSFRFFPLNPSQNPSLQQITNKRAALDILRLKAKIWQKHYQQTNKIEDLKVALDCYRLAHQILDQMRLSFDYDQSKYWLSEEYAHYRADAMEVAYEVKKKTQDLSLSQTLFYLIESGKATSLTDVHYLSTVKSKTIPQKLLDKEADNHRQITGLEIQLANTTDSASIETLQRKITNKYFQQSRLIEQFEQQYPNYYTLKYSSPFLQLKKLQNTLSADVACLSYFLTSSQLYTLVITREQVKVLVQPVDSTFRESISKFRALLSLNPGSKVYDGNAYSSTIYSKLVTPVLPFISAKKRLFIVRDAELNYLPFEVLAAKSDDYLLKKYAISYVYSVGLLMNKATLSSNNNRLAIAPFAGSISQKTAFRGAPLVPLPASEEEVRQIGGDIYLEKDATKKRFLEQYHEHGIIHFATHALTDDKDPMRSFVAFYPDGQEYRLFTNELYDLDLKEAQLVVLSACETGAGKLQRGEGVMSLARAFSYAGAQSVATTLWNANDEATAYISTHFHEYINDGLPLDEALQRAKLDFLKSYLGRRYDHPYYWANMVLIGRTDPIPTSTSWWWWMLVGLVLLGLVTIYFQHFFREKEV